MTAVRPALDEQAASGEGRELRLTDEQLTRAERAASTTRAVPRVERPAVLTKKPPASPQREGCE